MPSPLPANPPNRAYGTVPDGEAVGFLAPGTEDNPIVVSVEGTQTDESGDERPSESADQTSATEAAEDPVQDAVSADPDSGRQSPTEDTASAKDDPIGDPRGRRNTGNTGRTV